MFWWCMWALLQAGRAAANRPPRFLIDGQAEIVIRLKEGPETPVGSLIYRLRAVDPDGDVLQFGIREQIGSDILRLEAISSNEANIYLAKELDREVRDEYAFVLTLTDGNLGEGNFITQSFLLLVEDVNDNEPMFKPYPTAISVREDATPGVLTTVEATDLDEGAYGQVVYHLQELDGEVDSFTIQTQNGKGVIRLSSKLDYENKSLYQLRILAVDRANQGRVNTGTAAILIKVQDVEDQPPEFVGVIPIARISEDSPVGSSVLQVRAIDGDRGINNRISYSIISGGEDHFDIDSSSGVVYTTNPLDREDPHNNNGAYILEILATEESKIISPLPTASTEVTIIITDVNDETPQFRSERYVCEVPENAQQNTPVTYLQDAIPEVYDYDQGKNGTFELYLEGANGAFDVTPYRGVNEASFLIRVNDASLLDYERVTVMNFSLIAKETVTKDPKISIVPITVHIQDENDNFPEFVEQTYNVSIPENCGVGTTVAWVQAVDQDSGNYGTRGIRYTSIGGGIASLLHINSLSGVITVKHPGGDNFDRELVTRHYLTVEARDDLGKGNRNTAQLIIDIEDVNDNAPMFLSNRYEARLLENELQFESQLVLEARDADLNGTKNSEIQYTIVSGEYKNNFTIDPSSGIFSIVRYLDFEQIAGDNGNIRPVHLTVRAQDMGTPSLSSDVPVTIYVQDANDHAPLFQQMMYKRSIPEDMPGGTSIIEVKAVDLDGSAPNNRIVYRIQRGASDKFVIDSETGVISVAHGSSLDPDRTNPKINRYALIVIALDGGIGDQQLSAAVLVNITIVDVNNKPPIFEEPGQITIKENTQAGTTVFRAIARDTDDHPVLRYHIDKLNSIARDEEGTVVKPTEYDYLSLWDMNVVDGTIKIVRLLDREKVETIRLGLIVEDMAATDTGPQQTSSATLTIIVEDENDNNPRFRKPFYKRSVTENSKNGVAIANVIADDADKNRSITYYLYGAEELTKLVYLEPETGEVVVANKIDHEVHPWINLTIKATDSGIPPRSSVVELFIQVLDENDNNPYFEPSEYDSGIAIAEDAALGTLVATIKAKDADSGEYGKITYLLNRVSAQGKFVINPETGALAVASELDREAQQTYNLIIEAWDNYKYGYLSGESRNAFKQIMIHILDVNDNSPVLFVPQECVAVTEFHVVRDPVARVSATDDDDPSTPNGRVAFFIVGGTGAELFQLHQSMEEANTARVFARGSLKDRFGNYTLQVEARDAGQPRRFASESMRVCVSDYNDHAPMFVTPPQNVTIKVPENATMGSMVAEVHAIDADVGANGAVRYRLRADAPGHHRAFIVHALTGALTLKYSLDRQKQKIYEIRVEAYDLGTPTSLSSDLDIRIYVQNVDHYRPHFYDTIFSVNFTEHSHPGVEFHILPDVMEKDEIEQGDDPKLPVCYYIVKGNDAGLFELGRDTHRLSLARILDRETKSQHELLVHASEDCVSPPKYVDESSIEKDENLLNVTVNVLDINDNPPKFISKTFTGGITTEADFGTEFMHIKAHDLDEGENAMVSYYLVGEVKKTLSEGLENLVVSPFLVNNKTGAITLNFDPQKGMKGYFDFQVLANDTGGLVDEAQVFIYLLREDQRVRVVLRQHPAEIRDRVRMFRERLARVIGATVNVDDIRVHENKDGSVDKTKTDLYMHLVNGKDHSVMEVDQVLTLIDNNIEDLDDLFKEYNVLDTCGAELRAGAEGRAAVAPSAALWLAWVALLLAVLLALSLLLCLSQRAHYHRRLKAAKAYVKSTPGEPDATIGSSTARVPNTNKHSTQGSNPIWLHAYENDWYRNDEDQLSHSERDSLDENVLARESNEDDKPYFINTATYPSLEASVRSDVQNDQSKYNFYQQIDLINNAKNLETTEL